MWLKFDSAVEWVPLVMIIRLLHIHALHKMEHIFSISIHIFVHAYYNEWCLQGHDNTTQSLVSSVSQSSKTLLKKFRKLGCIRYKCIQHKIWHLSVYVRYVTDAINENISNNSDWVWVLGKSCLAEESFGKGWGLNRSGCKHARVVQAIFCTFCRVKWTTFLSVKWHHHIHAWVL